MKKVYYSLKDYYNEKFNTKVYKITIDAGFTCPNRDGTKGYGGCIYCDDAGSGNRAFKKHISIKDQIFIGKQFLKRRYKAEKFFLYYQAFTNTYANVSMLKNKYDEGMKYDNNDIVGLIIGTRPDCIDTEKLDLIASYTDKYEIWVEYGLQSIHQKSLSFINRRHSLEDYIKAVELTRKYPVKITTHIIFGLPTENKDEMLDTVEFVAKNKPDAIKIHSLYIPKNSKLGRIYRENPFQLQTEEEYIELLADAVEILPSDIIVARLTGETNKENLIAPFWVLNKQKIIREFKNLMYKRNSYQGKRAGKL